MLRSSACKQEKKKKNTAEAKVCKRVHFLNGDCNGVHFSVCVCVRVCLIVNAFFLLLSPYEVTRLVL